MFGSLDKACIKQSKDQLELSINQNVNISQGPTFDQNEDYFIILKNYRGIKQSSSQCPQQPPLDPPTYLLKRKQVKPAYHVFEHKEGKESLNNERLRSRGQPQQNHFWKNQSIKMPMLSQTENLGRRNHCQNSTLQQRVYSREEEKFNPRIQTIRRRLQITIRRIQAKIQRKENKKYQPRELEIKQLFERKLNRLNKRPFLSREQKTVKTLLQKELQELERKIQAGNLTYRAKRKQNSRFFSRFLTEITQFAFLQQQLQKKYLHDY